MPTHKRPQMTQDVHIRDDAKNIRTIMNTVSDNANTHHPIPKRNPVEYSNVFLLKVNGQDIEQLWIKFSCANQFPSSNALSSASSTETQGTTSTKRCFHSVTKTQQHQSKTRI